MDQRLRDAPPETEAPARGGGAWYKVGDGCWRWGRPEGSGGTFPRPGPDWTGELLYPGTRGLVELLRAAARDRDDPLAHHLATIGREGVALEVLARTAVVAMVADRAELRARLLTLVGLQAPSPDAAERAGLVTPIGEV